MTTERFLGSAWASVHGPVDARGLVVWVLELGFRGLVVGPGPRSMDLAGLRKAVADLPSEIAAVQVRGMFDPPAGEGSLASADAGDRRVAMARLQSSIGTASALGCSRILLDPGVARVSGPEGPADFGDPEVPWTAEQAKAQLARRDAVLDAALDGVCRGLYELSRAFPDMELCLLPSRHAHGLGDPVGLGHVFDDLPGTRLTFWHDVAVATRREELLGVAQGEWLELFGNRMSGMTLGDCSGGTLYLPPGAGGVDYPLLAAYRRRSGRPIPAVIELLPAVEPGEIPGVHAFLNKYGL